MKEKNFTPLRKFLRNNQMYYDLTELHEVSINVSEKDGFYIYNYGNAVLVPRDDEIIKMCRGLVLDGTGKVMNYPFDRFFNAHEKECDIVDWDSAEILEKLDGSLISVWWTGTEWEVTTRGSFYPNENAHNFKETFSRLFYNWKYLSPGYTYMFELISTENRIVTKYNEEFVTLIGARDLYGMKEINQKNLDKLAEFIGVRRPNRFKATNIVECRNLFEDMNDDEEGIIIVDQYMNRMKLKQESYLKMAKIISLKSQDVLDYMLGRTELDEDFTDMPELKEKIEDVRRVHDEVKEYSENIYNNIKHIESQKEFASHACNHTVKGILFSLRKGIKFDDINITWKTLEEYHSNMVVPTLDKIIILRGIPGSGKSTWVKELGLEHYVLSMDKIRLMYEAPCPHISQDNNAKVHKLYMEILEARMNNSSFTIVDAVHATKKYVNSYDNLIAKYAYEKRIKTIKVSLEEALERNLLR